jgi:dihydroorotate dehydrogenase (NAD+) catalytic subunit
VTQLGVEVTGIAFQNPVVLAAGTAAFGRALDGVVRLDALGGIVTKAVSLAPRKGNAAPRVAEFDGGMLNAIGLANPGVDEVLATELPWLASHVSRARVIVNIVGDRAEDFAAVIERVADAAPIAAYELNVSCPNVKAGGMEFGADPAALRSVVSLARAATTLPLFVKLSPTLGDIGGAARIAADVGANAISVVNTLPGLVVDVEARRPRIGFGSGGASGAALLPVGVLATHRVRRAVSLPILGVGGVTTANDALQYIIAGASLIGMGTATMRDPRAPERLVRELDAWCRKHDVARISDLVGTLEWPQ